MSRHRQKRNGWCKMKYSKEMALKAVLHGAYKIPKIGQDISKFSSSDLIWAEKHGIITPLKGELPLWVCSYDGYGYGDGYG